MKPKLFVAGCSVSDYTLVDEVYGEMLAEKLNFDYVHEAAGCGSNWRMWRKITNHIKRGNLTENDLLIVQYTTNERKEVWTVEEADWFNGNINLREKYETGGNIIRFKAKSYQWQTIKKEKLFLKVYEENFLNEDFENEVFETQNLMFQNLLKSYNIPVVFFNFKVGSPFIQDLGTKVVDILEISEDAGFFLENDLFHLNTEGHKYVANKLFNYVTINKIR